MFSGKEKEEESEEIKISLSGFERSAENFNTQTSLSVLLWTMLAT